MKQWVILSGKGGTGKTSVTASLAHLASTNHKLVLADADVDAANLEFLLDPQLEEQNDFISGQLAAIQQDACIACWRCQEVCRFEAVRSNNDTFTIDATACEGCAACYYECPTKAIEMTPSHAGEWYRSNSRYGTLFHAHLYAAQENSGKLVSTVKQSAALWASSNGEKLLLVDGPPGIGCPVISACSGADLAILVVEPTVSGEHDLERVLQTTTHFGVPAVIIINKADINPERAGAIEAFAQTRGVRVLGRLPFDTGVTQAALQGQPVTVWSDLPISRELVRIWGILESEL